MFTRTGGKDAVPRHSQIVLLLVKPLRNEASTEGTRTFGCRPDARKRNSPLPSF